MAGLVAYVRAAGDTFAERAFCRVDSLCFAWLSYLRFPVEFGVGNRAGARLVDLCDPRLVPGMLAGLHDEAASQELLAAMVASPRFANVRVCLHVDERDPAQGMQFSATTFVLPEGLGACVAFRGTDDSLTGWKENLRLACAAAVPAQRRAHEYLESVAAELGVRLWVCGHSKGGALATYACCKASDETRGLLAGCLSHDGPGLSPELAADLPLPHDVPLDKMVARQSLVGLLFERSQQGLDVVRSSAEGLLQHAPLSWEIEGNDFVAERGVDYDSWRLAQRLNDWLCAMEAPEREGFAELLGWMLDATAEPTFSSFLRRWSSNRRAMQAALEAAPGADRALFERAMDDLVTTLVVGSRQEHGLDADGSPQGKVDAAARKVEDLSAHTNDRLAQLDRLTGRS